MRRWHDGQVVLLDGVTYRVTPGNRCDGDLKLWWNATGEWRPVFMRAGGLLADFFYENEDNRYPQPTYRGGRYYLDMTESAALNGWYRAETRLRAEADAARFERRYE